MHFIFLLFAALIFTCPAALAGDTYSTNITGVPGLLTIPNARMYAPGTIIMHTGALDPYFHGALGLQFAKPFYIALRQTALTSSLGGQAERLYPGVDLRLRLFEENLYVPEITIGMQSTLGHKKTASEYLAFSKNFGNFDLTSGMGWGRMNGTGNIGNPLKIFGSHFSKNRNPDSEMPEEITDLFTGKNAGLFAGVEYLPPHRDFSIKAEWGSNYYEAEQTSSDTDAPAPWSIGISFKPLEWLNMNFGIAGAEKILGSLTFHPPLKKWPWRISKRAAAEPLHPYRAGFAMPGMMETSATHEDIIIHSAQASSHEASAMIELSSYDETLPYQAGMAARHMANNSGEAVEELIITPTYMGLRGPALSLMRRDLEQALVHKQGSPQEVWRNARFIPDTQNGTAGLAVASPWRYHFILDNQISLSEEDSGILHRTSILFDGILNLGHHFIAGGAVRLNVHDNLERIEYLRPMSLLPVRSDINRFTAQTVSIDRSYLGWMMTPKTDFHVALSAGYLEEMYAGAGGEVLYRPFGKTFAVGADAWIALRRDPYVEMNMGLNGDHLLSGHINAWYEIPETDLTVQARLGRYLAEDIGGTLGIEKRMNNGIRLSAFATATDSADFDLFGGSTHLYSGMKLSVPFGSVPHIPRGSEARVAALPLGRDSGQALDHPLPLYDMTERFSLRHISTHWNDVAE